jgi:hypothetical protein
MRWGRRARRTTTRRLRIVWAGVEIDLFGDGETSVVAPDPSVDLKVEP